MDGGGLETTLCYIIHDGRYLMMRRDKKDGDSNLGKYLGIGGKFQDGETADECMRREALEETGFVLTELQPRGIIYFVNDVFDDEDMYLYTATKFTFADGSPVPDGFIPECEEGTFQWVPVESVSDLPMWEGDRHFFKEIAAGNEAIDMTLRYQGYDLVGVENRNPMA